MDQLFDSKKYNAIDSIIEKGGIVLVFSEESLEEFLSVIQKPKLSKYFPASETDELLSLFHKYGKLVKVESNVKICRDTKDNFLLNLAIDSEADYLVTGDLDLLDLNLIMNTKIITWSTFLKEMK